MSRPAKLPGIPQTPFKDPAQRVWAEAVTEHLEVRAGARGSPLERAATLRDLQTTDVRISGAGSVVAARPGEKLVPLTNGGTAIINIDAFSQSLRQTKLFKDLQLAIGDTSRFETVANEIKEILRRSIASEAQARGTSISQTEMKIQENSRAVASLTTEVLAALNSATAGIRQVQFAFATESTAMAGEITALEARLQVEVNPADLRPVPPTAAYADLAALTAAVPPASADGRYYYRVADGTGEALYRSDGSTWNLVGSQSSAKLEQVLLVTADKTEGLESQYTLKVSAGRAIAGFGIAATERDGVPESAFIVQADAFAVAPTYNFAQSSTPTALAIGDTWYKTDTEESYYATATGTGDWVLFTPTIPFSIDTTTNTVFINGSLRVNGSSTSLTNLNTGYLNFNNRNDRNALAVPDPTIASDGSAVDHTANTDGSVDMSLEWSWAGSDPDIDGWIVKVYSAATNAAYTFGTDPAAEQVITLSADKRAMIFRGVAANLYYKFGVQAYRVVDPDVDASGLIKSALVVPSLATENPYRPAANVAFAGDVTGTINGTSAATVVGNAIDGAVAYLQVNNASTGLATKMGLATKNIIAGGGGIRAGTIDWDSAGTVVSGYGTAMTANGIFARNVAGNITFSLNSSNGSALFGGDIETAGRMIATGGNTFSGILAAMHAVAGTVGGAGLYANSGVGTTAVSADTTNGWGLLAKSTSGIAVEGRASGSGGRGVEAEHTAGGVALNIPTGYIQRPYSTTGVIEVFNTSGVTQGIFRYEFRENP